MEIVDVHVHALPRGELNGGETDARWETVRAGLQRWDIRRAVLVPINDPLWQPVPEMNDYSERLVAAEPGLAGLVDIDLSQAHLAGGIQALEADIEHRVSHGLRGIKVHLQNLGMPASDWRLWPVYRLAGELGVPVTIHCHPGSSPGRMTDSHPAEIEKVVRGFHKTCFLIAHLGGVLYFEHMPWLVYDNVFFETSGILPDLQRYYGVDRVRFILEQIGYERLLFGSDHPAADLDAGIASARALIPEEHQAAVFAGNALALGRRFGWWADLEA